MSQEDDRIRRVQRQADEITDITRKNIQMSLDRGERLEDMEDKASVLETQGRQFHTNAVKLRRKFCMQSWRLTFLILILLAVIAVILYFIIDSKK